MSSGTFQRKGPSWTEVSALQGAIQASYGGFCVVCHYATRPDYGPSRAIWMAKWGPDIVHAHVAHYRAYTGYWPDRRFQTVPELLLELLADLDRALRRDEELRRSLHQPPLALMVLPPVANCTFDAPEV